MVPTKTAFGLAVIAAAISTATAQDTVRVRAGSPRWGTNVSLNPVYVIGGAPDYDLGNLYTGTVDRTGRVYTFDIRAKQIRAYDAAGKFVRIIGRFGAGPGEYRWVTAMSIIHDSILVVHDDQNGRLTIFQPDGRLVRTIPFGRSVFRVAVQFADTAAHLYFGAWVTGVNSSGQRRSQILRMSSDGTVTDSFQVPALRMEEEGWRPFDPNAGIRPSALTGYVYGDGDTYRFFIRPPRGALRVVEHDWTPVAFKPDERAQYVAYGEAVKRRGDPYYLPAAKPAYYSLSVDWNGRTWVHLFSEGVKRPRAESSAPARPDQLPVIDWASNTVFDVYDPSGVYLARLARPDESYFVFAQGDRVWLRTTGPDGEHLLVAYRITGRTRP